MPESHVIVDTVQAIDRSDESATPDLVVVHLPSGRVFLDQNDRRAAIWEAVLDELRRSGEPVYLEVDPKTNVITRLLQPRSVLVRRIASASVGKLLEVELEVSQTRHHLNITRANYQRLLIALRAAHERGTHLLVTATLNEHEIIDVRPAITPFATGPAAMRYAGPRNERFTAASGVTGAQAQQLFALAAGQPQIPFRYPDDGCWARAHEMCRLMIDAGYQPRKVWIYGNLMVNTRNSPCCGVQWMWHVAPTLAVNVDDALETQVIDPALFTGPVPQATWMDVQSDPAAALFDTGTGVYIRSPDGLLSDDPSYTQTQQDLAYYSRQLALRTADDGPPPYAKCP